MLKMRRERVCVCKGMRDSVCVSKILRKRGGRVRGGEKDSV